MQNTKLQEAHTSVTYTYMERQKYAPHIEIHRHILLQIHMNLTIMASCYFCKNVYSWRPIDALRAKQCCWRTRGVIVGPSPGLPLLMSCIFLQECIQGEISHIKVFHSRANVFVYGFVLKTFNYNTK